MGNYYVCAVRIIINIITQSKWYVVVVVVVVVNNVVVVVVNNTHPVKYTYILRHDSLLVERHTFCGALAHMKNNTSKFELG